MGEYHNALMCAAYVARGYTLRIQTKAISLSKPCTYYWSGELKGYRCSAHPPHEADVWESLIRPGGVKYCHQWKLAIFAIFLHFRQQKMFKGTRLGPSMDPTGPIKYKSKFSSFFKAVFALSALYIIHYTFEPLWPCWNTFVIIMELYKGSRGPPPGPSWNPK